MVGGKNASHGEMVRELSGKGVKVTDGFAITAHQKCAVHRPVSGGRSARHRKNYPDWQPVMKKAAVIITSRGGRTCHAAIVSRELCVPAIVGTEHGTETLAIPA